MSVVIQPFAPQDRPALLDLSLRAWAPVFPLMRNDVPDFVYTSFYPQGWERRQTHDLTEILDNEPEHVDVAHLDGKPVGWVCTRIHAEDHMAEIYILAVDPDYQRRGIGRALLEHACNRARAAGMRMVMVETGGDAGHEPARRAYEAQGFVRWPVARYFKKLGESNGSLPQHETPE